eukprot:759672-Prymnesium_polylepis.1
MSETVCDKISLSIIALLELGLNVALPLCALGTLRGSGGQPCDQPLVSWLRWVVGVGTLTAALEIRVLWEGANDLRCLVNSFDPVGAVVALLFGLCDGTAFGAMKVVGLVLYGLGFPVDSPPGDAADAIGCDAGLKHGAACGDSAAITLYWSEG